MSVLQYIKEKNLSVYDICLMQREYCAKIMVDALDGLRLSEGSRKLWDQLFDRVLSANLLEAQIDRRGNTSIPEVK